MIRTLSILGLCCLTMPGAALADATPAPHTAMKHDAMTGGAMKHDAMKGDAMKHDSMKGDAMRHDAMKGSAMKGAAMKHDVMKPEPKPS